MTERAKVIEETKKEISSLLVCLGATRSNPGIPINQFEGDYRALIGSPLPYRDLGYGTLEDFLLEIPDTVNVIYGREGPILKAVENDNISHIVALVDNQKTTVAATRLKKAKQSKRGRGRGAGRNSGGFRDTFTGNSTPSYSRSAPQNSYNHPGGKRFQSKPENNAQKIGRTEGFVPPPDKRAPARGPQPAQPSVPALTRGMIRELLTAYPNGIYGKNIDTAFSRMFGQTLNPCKLGFKNLYTMFAALQDILELEERDDDFRVKQLGLKPIEKQQYQKDKRTKRDYNLDPGALKVDIQKVLQINESTGTWAADFPKSFKDTIGIELPLKQLGFTSVVELMGEYPDVVTIERASAKDWKLYDKSSRNSQQKQKSAPSRAVKHVPRAATKPSTYPEVRPALKEAVRQVVVSHSEGLPLCELPETFREMVGKPLPVQEIGYPSLDILIQQLTTDRVLYSEYKGQGLVLLKAVDQTPATNYLLKRPGLGEMRYSVPADAVGPGVNYPRMPYPEPGPSSIEVIVSHVENPCQFWFQCKGDATTLELEYLMDDLEEVYYGPNSDKYRMPESLIVPSQLAVAIFPQDNNWHRVTILQRIGPDFVMVFFTDYGGSCSVHKDNLRLLKNRFLQHPAQAIEAKFAFLKPNGSGWTPAATRRMLDLTAQRTLLAYVVEIEQEDQVLAICLCDTNGTEDIHIQDQLVEEGHASFVLSEDNPEQAGNVNADTGHLPTQPGSSDNVGDNVAYVSPMLRNSDVYECEHKEDETFDLRPSCIKFVELTEMHSVHIIKFEERPYLLSSEISSFFWEKDLLRSLLRQKRIDIPRKVLPKEEYSDLFNEFVYNGISGVTDREGQQKSHLTIYRLNEIPRILDEFNHPSQELRQAIQYEIAKFNPDDPYWKGECEGSDVTSESGSCTLQSNELTVALKALQYRRQNIVEKMTKSMSDMTETQKSVEELRQIEDNIDRVQNLIKRAEKRETKTGEDFVQQCISDQYSEASSRKSGSNTMLLPTTPMNPAMAVGPTSANLTGLGLASSGPSFGAAGAGSTVNTMDMTSLMAALMPNNMNMMGSAGLPGMGMNMSANLTQEQQQFMRQYNLLLSQQMMGTNPLMMGVNPMMMGTNPMLNMGGMGFPAANMMNSAPSQLSMADMSRLFTGQGDLPNHSQKPQ